MPSSGLAPNAYTMEEGCALRYAVDGYCPKPRRSKILSFIVVQKIHAAPKIETTLWENLDISGTLVLPIRL